MAKFDAQSWEFTQRIIRIGHNRRVKKYFRDIKSDTRAATGRQAIKVALLIRDDDSAIETMNKMLYFSNYLDRDLIATQSDGYQIKKGQDIPQLVIIFRDVDPKAISGNYQLVIPHYDGDRTPRIPSYQKGNHWARWILKDNSQIIVNAKTEAEALKTIKKLEKLVDRKYRTDETPWLTTGLVSKKTYKEVKVRPHRADYYPEGKASGYPKWRSYL